MPPKPLPGGLYNPVNAIRFEKAFREIRKKIPSMTRTELHGKLKDLKKPKVENNLISSKTSSKINKGPQISAQDFGSTNLLPFKKGGRVKKNKILLKKKFKKRY